MDFDKILKEKQTLLNDIKKRYHRRPNKKTVIAARVTSYVIDEYRSSKPYLTGKIEFQEGGEKEACFFIFKQSEAEDLAKKIFGQTSKMADDPGILKPYFLSYYELKKIWILCYDKFDSLLSDDVSQIVLTENRGDSIRKLLETIKYIHKRRLFHGALKERCSYVLISGQIKIIFGSSLRTRDDLTKKRKNPYYEELEEVERTKIQDFKDFRDMLKDLILQLGVDWEDKESFFQFFDRSAKYWSGYDGFVNHLINHPSLKKSDKRNEYLFKIDQSMKTKCLREGKIFKDKLKEEEFTTKYSNWNEDEKLSKAPRLKQVYNKEGVNYKGTVRDLIRFLANAYVHYRSADKEEDFDHDVRTLYPDFLNRLHNYL